MLWITLEGLDGCGKSTQSSLLAARINAVLTREPGGTALGARLRHELLHTDGPEVVSDTTEMLLYAADRAHHLNNVVSPALSAGVPVVSDRSVWSSVAYQGFGRGLTPELVIKANDIALGGVWPDAVVYIDATASSRKGRMDRELDRIESAGEEFFVRTETGFRLLAATHNWVVVDGDGTVDEVHTRIMNGLSGLLGERFDLLAGTNGDANGK